MTPGPNCTHDKRGDEGARSLQEYYHGCPALSYLNLTDNQNRGEGTEMLRDEGELSLDYEHKEDDEDED